MDNTITISFEDVASSSSKIKKCSKELSSIITDLEKVINDIQSGWDSQASQTFKNRFKSFVDKFDDCKASIDAYATFLDKTVEAYRAVDTKISQAAEQ